MSESLTDLIALIHEERDRALLREQGPWPRSQPVASDLHPCARAMTYDVLYWQERPAFPLSLLARFEVGKDAESRLVRRLNDYGVKIIEQQRTFELKNQAGTVLLRGRIDGLVEWHGRRIPIEFKTTHPLLFNKLTSVDAMLAHPFCQKWPRQLWAYEYLHDSETGLMLIDNLLGEWRLIEVPLNFEEMDKILRVCEASVEAVLRIRRDGQTEEQALPGFFPDVSVCLKCIWLAKRCNPPGVSAGAGLIVLDDEELSDKLDRRAELHEASEEYRALDQEIKQAVRGRDNLVIGSWLIRGKEREIHYQPQAARTTKQWVVSIERLHRR